jgi:exosortase/archaeosortase family protein
MDDALSHATGSRSRWALALAAPGLLALAWDPARWLWRTWQDPAYASDGAWIALVTAGLLCASWWSGPAPAGGRARRWAWGLLGLTAVLRVVGRVLAVNTIGALALVVDVAAVAMLLGVSRRRFALHPAVLAAFFALSLPFEHLAKRLLGHPLQLLAAMASEVVLSPFFGGLEREGVFLLHPSIELAVDLPCSGARGIVLFTSIALGLWTCHRLSLFGIAKLTIAVLGGALFANVARIAALFVGSAFALPVIAEPWHSALGVAALALGALPMLGVFRAAPLRRSTAYLQRLSSVAAHPWREPSHHSPFRWPAALAITAVGLAVASVPHSPLDVAPADHRLRLPTTLGPFDGREIPLAPNEKRFFTQWGGGAEKRRYDDGSGVAHTALLVRTRSPLRHLHGPDLCLVGAGHTVQRIGVIPGAVPSILYRSVAPDGTAWRVEASFTSDGGERASSVSEVVWRWLARPDATWNLVERISPWNACEQTPERCARFDRALFTSLDLPATPLDASLRPRNPTHARSRS